MARSGLRAPAACSVCPVERVPGRSACRVERVPETVLEKLIGPVGEGALRVSTAVRRLQHGRLQSYILYLVAGLAALALLVLLEGTL